ncbi:polymerase [Acidovorax carolinensis]|uniref:Polymerase n=1 Tax=Acidovorax carolinensis TaxID=553814 RepID=A0A240U9C8_9BURK|nr:O-antigen ligase family protein [Acidovorax carolinensis]ART56404.1 polymerase [Acidovorax carolinensis]ART57640.1 polymerase [Acidovorax carolinensis]
MTAQRWFGNCASLGAFMVPGLALWLPSGYSHGALLLLLAALASAPTWWRRPAPRAAWWLMAAFLCMAGLWMLDVGTAWGMGSMERPVKYLLALPCMFYLMTFRPRAAWLWTGIAVGAMGGGLVGLYQTGVLGLPRANGYTNAIQYGNLSLLLAVMSGLVLVVQWRRWVLLQRVLLAVAVALGVVGSVLSQSRGGWLALVLVLPVCAWLLVRTTGQRRIYWGLGALVFAAVALSQVPAVERRLDEARQELQIYQERGDGSSSVGQRLVHWRLAWEMGRDRPLIGWGRAGYIEEKERRVAAGQAHPSVLEYGHAHNEVLDLFAKRGLLGVLLLMVFYGVPLAIFWPTDARIRDGSGKVDNESLSLCLVGVLLPLSYIGFGLTQVFLAHNSGNMFYLFMCPLVLAALHERRARMGCPRPV